jgi:hypothetical protein
VISFRELGIAILVVVCCVCLYELAAAASPLRLTVRPDGFAFAPADVEVRLHVEPGGRRREVLLQLDGSGGFYRSSVFPIRADLDAPTLQPPAWYRSVPPGDYVITATLTDCAPDGCGRRVELARAERQIRLLESIPRSAR